MTTTIDGTIDQGALEALAPCPFCGAEAEWCAGEYGDKTPWRYLACSVCEAMGPADDKHGDDAAKIAAWNRRARILSSVTISRDEAVAWVTSEALRQMRESNGGFTPHIFTTNASETDKDGKPLVPLYASPVDSRAAGIEEDAARWRALMSSQKMHYMGSAGFEHSLREGAQDGSRKLEDQIATPREGEPWHFGMEFWSGIPVDARYPDTFERQMLTAYVDAIRQLKGPRK